jgi:hypothetical protein
MSKKKGKSKKSSLLTSQPAVTTRIIRRERDRISSPDISDAFGGIDYMHDVYEDVSERIILKTSILKSDALNLSSMKIYRLPDLISFSTTLKTIVDINLSRNNLFDTDNVFEVI